MNPFVLEIDRSKPRQAFSLNGIWQLEPGEKDVKPAGFSHTVQVPGLVDLAIPAYPWQNHAYHWLRTSFRFAAGTFFDSAWLRLDQAMFGTEVWLNGRRVGCDIACYTSQEYDIKARVALEEDNELLIRIGARDTLPPESAVGRDQERTEFIPGIWGDVNMIVSGNPRIGLVQVIPHIDRKRVEARVTVENKSDSEFVLKLEARVVERHTRRAVSLKSTGECKLAANTEQVVNLDVQMKEVRLWSVEDPFLYQCETCVVADGKTTDEVRTTFGMREFKIVGGDFFFNGKQIFLRGGNIAFHRFLSDADRGSLPWDPDWIKRALIDIPREHHFNFFRSHIGQMYNRWYDIADEYGMLLQNEWQFWTTSGTKEQIRKEFTRWVKDNWNHPSIIIWDALNESSDAVVQHEIVPEMKTLDPTRPWESVDFIEQHPYIYSLGPVLNDQRLGFGMGLDELEKLSTPSVVNEFLWWWLDKEWKPTILMQGVIERWLGKDYTNDELITRQSFLAQELVELFRRMRMDAIQPFVYISNNAGPTANWFMGHIRDLQPKPLLKALKNAFSPFGISMELWDRHFLSGESRTVRMFVFNDNPVPCAGTVRYGVVRFDGEWTYDKSLKVSVEPAGSYISLVQVVVPRSTGEYRIRAELHGEGSDEVVAFSEKIAHVFDSPGAADHLRQSSVVVLEDSGEITGFLNGGGISTQGFSIDPLRTARVVIVAHGMVNSGAYSGSIKEVTRFVEDGGTLVLIEPEYGIQTKETIRALDDLSLMVERRKEADRGGYDSYVFAEDLDHPLWRGIEKKHLHMFNGGLGGEVVSQHDITCPVEYRVHARCGLGLAVEAVFEVGSGKGRIIVSRLQIRRRLMSGSSPETPYARRMDPVLQRYMLNLIRYAMEGRDFD